MFSTWCYSTQQKGVPANVYGPWTSASWSQIWSDPCKQWKGSSARKDFSSFVPRLLKKTCTQFWTSYTPESHCDLVSAGLKCSVISPVVSQLVQVWVQGQQRNNSNEIIWWVLFLLTFGNSGRVLVSEPWSLGVISFTVYWGTWQITFPWQQCSRLS